jgi:hypothetical protein
MPIIPAAPETFPPIIQINPTTVIRSHKQVRKHGIELDVVMSRANTLDLACMFVLSHIPHLDQEILCQQSHLSGSQHDPVIHGRSAETHTRLFMRKHNITRHIPAPSRCMLYIVS